MLLEAPEAALEPPHRLDQEERDKAEDGSEDDRQTDQLRAPEPAEPFGKDGHGRPRAADEVRDDAGHETREKDGVLDPPEVEHLDPEEGAGDRCPEDGREAAADAADHEAATVLVVQAEDIREQARNRGPDLGARSFLPDRASEGERHDRRQKLDGRDLPRDPAGLPMNRGDDSFGPVAARRRRELPDQEHARREREREK